MLDYYPVSIAAHGVALNITVQSYMGQLCFGLIACRRAVPDVRDITVAMLRAFDSFKQLPLPEAAAGSPPHRQGPPHPRGCAAARPRRAETAAQTSRGGQGDTRTPAQPRASRLSG
jgi:hypothetical protein